MRLVGDFEGYLHEALGLRVQARPWDESNYLPVFLRDAFKFYRVVMMDVPFLLAEDTRAREQPPGIIQKQLDQVRKKWDGDIIYLRSAISSYNRRRLVQHKIPFVVPGNQMFLPNLGVDLREYFRRGREEVAALGPATQVLLLHVLCTHQKDPLTPTTAAALLAYTPMTMTRAFTELEELGVGEQRVRGRNRQILFATAGMKLWEKVLPYMRTPVKKRLFLEKGIPDKKLTGAGLTALAYYTSTSEPAVPVFALRVDEWKGFNRNVQLLRGPEPGGAEVELWSYRPELFAKNGLADRFSLFLSLKDSNDERVEIALDELMDKMPW